MDSTTGENATSRQVRNVGGLKESGVKEKSGDYEREKAGRPPFSPQPRSRGGDMSYWTEVADV